MKRYPLAAVAALAIGLSACLDDPAAPQCNPLTNSITGTAGDTVITSSGLRYIETEAGTTTQEATWCNGAQVSYVGTLTDGTQFDEGTIAFTPGIDNVIPGFSLGVVGMKLDANRRLIVNPELGYGDRQNGIIPPNSTLIFDIELVAIQ